MWTYCCSLSPRHSVQRFWQNSGRTCSVHPRAQHETCRQISMSHVRLITEGRGHVWLHATREASFQFEELGDEFSASVSLVMKALRQESKKRQITKQKQNKEKTNKTRVQEPKAGKQLTGRWDRKDQTEQKNWMKRGEKMRAWIHEEVID